MMDQDWHVLELEVHLATASPRRLSTRLRSSRFGLRLSTHLMVFI
jgi:hypothetical protein